MTAVIGHLTQTFMFAKLLFFRCSARSLFVAGTYPRHGAVLSFRWKIKGAELTSFGADIDIPAKEAWIHENGIIE